MIYKGEHMHNFIGRVIYSGEILNKENHIKKKAIDLINN